MGLQSSFTKVLGAGIGAGMLHQKRLEKQQVLQQKMAKAEEAMKARKEVIKAQRKKRNEIYVSIGGQPFDVSKLPKESLAQIKKEMKKK